MMQHNKPNPQPEEPFFFFLNKNILFNKAPFLNGYISFCFLKSQCVKYQGMKRKEPYIHVSRPNTNLILDSSIIQCSCPNLYTKKKKMKKEIMACLHERRIGISNSEVQDKQGVVLWLTIQIHLFSPPTISSNW